MTETIKALVDAGKASAGPPLGPALGPLGVNIMQIINTGNHHKPCRHTGRVIVAKTAARRKS